ncbi:MAG: translation initiation factor IF-3, partial [Bacilli bacterium]
ITDSLSLKKYELGDLGKKYTSHKETFDKLEKKHSKRIEEQKKKEKELKAKQQKVVVKEIRFGPQTDDHDYEFKKRHARAFLEEGSKLKAYVFFKGRSIIFKDQGEILLLRLAQELEDVGKVEQLPKLEGKRMIMMMGPKK